MALLSFARSWALQSNVTFLRSQLPPPGEAHREAGRGGRVEASWTFPGAHGVGPHCPLGGQSSPRCRSHCSHTQEWLGWSSAGPCSWGLGLCFRTGQKQDKEPLNTTSVVRPDRLSPVVGRPGLLGGPAIVPLVRAQRCGGQDPLQGVLWAPGKPGSPPVREDPLHTQTLSLRGVPGVGGPVSEKRVASFQQRSPWL